jgi:signal transduction histidine kinase
MTTTKGYARGVLLAFAAVALVFFGSTLYVNWRNLAIDARTESLVSDWLPSIEHLAAAGDGLRELERSSDDYPDLAPEARPAARRAIEKRRGEIGHEITAYSRIVMTDLEASLYDPAVPDAMRAVDVALGQLLLEVDEGRLAAARVTADREVRTSVAHTAALLRTLVELNSRGAHEDAERIAAVRKSGNRTALILDALAMLIVVFAATSVLRLFRAHQRLLETHNELVERRANDLELFGRRVAHDLLSPLSALTYCLTAFKRATEGDSKLQDAMARARACVGRAQGLVDGVFEFSRSGGRPIPGTSSEVRPVVDEVRGELRMNENADQLEVVVEPFEACRVACNRGVLTSILTNLMRNAVKYMSDSAVKRITVRVQSRKNQVRVEVEDTGPGVPTGLEKDIFEPYVRAEGVTQPGLGLGLATVKRFCEGHGGEVGVRSTAGGSVFWFTLPKPREADATPHIRLVS